MSFESQYPTLLEVIEDPLFPEIDLALRFGRHVDAEDTARYEFLRDAQAHLERFYQRYGYEFVHASGGYYFLLPQAERLGRRHLGLAEMLAGQALALTWLDPSTVETGGLVTRAQIVEMLAHIVGEARLMAALHPRKRRADERLAHESVRRELEKALRTLAGLGFCDLVDEERISLRVSVLRFCEPVQGMGDPRQALEALMAGGRAIWDPETAIAPEGDGSVVGAADGDSDEDAVQEEDAGGEA
jgi:chromosome partition protein MukE